MGTPSIQQLMRALQNSWGKDTSFTPDDWSPRNPARGQCLVSTLVVQDYFGGDLQRCDVKGNDFEEIHYCNVLSSGATLDSTAIQYSQPVQFTITPIKLKGYPTARERYMADLDTQRKYELLRERVARDLSR